MLRNQTISSKKKIVNEVHWCCHKRDSFFFIHKKCVRDSGSSDLSIETLVFLSFGATIMHQLQSEIDEKLTSFVQK